MKKQKAEKFSQLLFYTALKTVCAKIEYDQPDQAFDGEEGQSGPSHTFKPFFKL